MQMIMFIFVFMFVLFFLKRTGNKMGRVGQREVGLPVAVPPFFRATFLLFKSCQNAYFWSGHVTTLVSCKSLL